MNGPNLEFEVFTAVLQIVAPGIAPLMILEFFLSDFGKPPVFLPAVQVVWIAGWLTLATIYVARRKPHLRWILTLYPISIHLNIFYSNVVLYWIWADCILHS